MTCVRLSHAAPAATATKPPSTTGSVGSTPIARNSAVHPIASRATLLPGADSPIDASSGARSRSPRPSLSPAATIKSRVAPSLQRVTRSSAARYARNPAISPTESGAIRDHAYDGARCRSTICATAETCGARSVPQAGAPPERSTRA
jgi:hypothetical protein